jgi:hypothetical protein
MVKKQCYVCGAQAVDVEHVPPTSYFPKGKKSQLITVPSCALHNYHLQHDQEYVRAIVATEQSTNSFARQFSEDKVVRSILRSQRMFNDVFSGAEPTLGLDGKPTAKLITDLSRFNRVMQMMAYGLYFHLNHKRYLGGFDIHSPNFTSTGIESEGDRQYMDVISRSALKSNFQHVQLPNEDVFALGINVKNDFEFAYRLEFYYGFIVLAVSVPPWRKPKPLAGREAITI